jgi:hypothetical protein
MIITLTLIIWLAQSGVEWKLVRSSEWMKRNFHGLRAQAISGVIGFALSGLVAVGISKTYGAAFAIATILGLFTNELTFNLYEGIYKAWQYVKRAPEGWRAFKTRFGHLFDDFIRGIKGVGMFIFMVFVGIGKFVRFIGWLCSLPTKLMEKMGTRTA